jgi:hypothetical protein
LYADRNDIHPFSNFLPLGVREYKLFLIGFNFPFFAGISILSTYPARLSLCSSESFNAAETLYIFPEVFDEIISDISVEFNGFSDYQKTFNKTSYVQVDHLFLTVNIYDERLTATKIIMFMSTMKWSTLWSTF